MPFQSPEQTKLDFCWQGWVKGEVYKRKVNTRDELLARILDAAACIKKREDQLRQTTRDLRKRVAIYIEDEDGIFEYSLSTLKKLCKNCHEKI